MSIYKQIEALKLSLSNQTNLSNPKNKISAYFCPLSWMDFIADATKHETTELLEVRNSHVMILGKEPIEMRPVNHDFFHKIMILISNQIMEINADEIYFSIPTTHENMGLFGSIKNLRGILLFKAHDSNFDFFQIGSKRWPLNFKNMQLDTALEEFKVSLGSSYPNLPVYAYTGCFPIHETV